MANHARRPARRLARPAKQQVRKSASASQGAQRPKAKPKQVPPPVPEQPRTLRLGAVPGATPGKWIDAWKLRMPHVSIELVPIEAADQRTALEELDAALIRLPLVDDTLHIIALYDEEPVVVAAIDSHLMAAEELTASDLAGEVLMTPQDDVLGPLDLPDTLAPTFPALPTTANAIATAATGVGIVVVPMSLARMHQRKDVDYRILQGAPTSTVALVWPREKSTADIDTFVGIVRGRTPNSSR